MTESDLRSSHDPRSRHLAVATAIALVAVLAARILGPTDLWHQTQPRTISYTVDMLVHGGSSWLLPVDFGGVPATKPPLVNWLATPFVAALGRASELGHKMPSVLAMAAMVAILARIGVRLAPGVGWLAALFCLSAYPFFKLGYLARPDMVLTALLLGAWWSATRLLLDDPPRRRAWQALFWTCSVAVAFTKGPVAVLPLVYVPIAARLVSGRWSAALRIGPLWAVPAIALVAGYYAVLWRLDPRHVYEVLWKSEVLGRVTGESPEVRPMRFWKDVVLGPFKMPAYFFVRFLPWSVPAIVGAAAAFPRGRVADPPRRILLSAVLWSIVVIMPFSFAAGKRADYIVPAYPTMALVAAWWMLNGSPWPRLWRLAVAVAAGAIVVLAIVNWIGTDERRSTIDAMNGIAARLEEERDRNPAPPLVVVDPLFMTHLSSMATTGRPADSSEENILEALDRGEALRIGYTRQHVGAAFLARLDELEAAGRLHERWHVPLQWEHDKQMVDLDFVFADVSGAR